MRWLRRNLAALIAIPVLLAALWGLAAWQKTTTYFTPSGENGRTVSEGATAEWEGATLGPIAAVRTPSEDAPHGAYVITVTLPFRVDSGSFWCATPVLREVSGEKRAWGESGLDLPDLYDSDEQATCWLNEGESASTVTARYIVPDDAVGPFAVDLPLQDVDYLRFLTTVREP